MPYSLEGLSEINSHQWDEFVHASQQGTLFHSFKWKKILEDVFNLKCRYYLLREEQRVVGICPFIEQSAGPFRGLYCIPYSEFNNLLMDDTFDTTHNNEVMALYSKEYSFLHFNSYNPMVMSGITYDMDAMEDTGQMIIDLKEKTPDFLWEKQLSTYERKKIRRFEKDGFELMEVRRIGDIEQYYRYYTENLNRFDGTIMPFSFFQKLQDSFSSNELRIGVLMHPDDFAGGMLILLDPAKKTANFACLALNRALPNRYTPTYYLFWEGINWAWDHGMTKISLGRQKFEPENPRFRNKVKFGAEYVPIHTRLVILSKTASLLHRLRRSARSVGMHMVTPSRPSSYRE